MDPSRQDRVYWDYYSYYSPCWSVNMMAPVPVDCATSLCEESGTETTSPPGDLPESEPEVLRSLQLPTPTFVACSTASDKHWGGV